MGYLEKFLQIKQSLLKRYLNIEVDETTNRKSVRNYYNDELPNALAGGGDSMPANIDSFTKRLNYNYIDSLNTDENKNDSIIEPDNTNKLNGIIDILEHLSENTSNNRTPYEILEKLTTELDKKLAKEFYDALNKKDTKTVEKLLKQIDDKSYVNGAYTLMYNKNFEDEIIQCKGIDKKLAEKVFKIIHKYANNREIKDSKIENDYWEGDSFDVKFDGNEIFITNNSTKEESYIDMDKLFKNLNPKDKVGMMMELQELPGEVLFDISRECKKIGPLWNIRNRIRKLLGLDTVSGYYVPSMDKISIKDYGAIVHELGHAIDARYKLKIFNVFATRHTSKFKAAFKIGMERYKNAGNKQYDQWKSKEKNRESAYCTANVLEMFAECYDLLMRGQCRSRDAIIKYFPECLEEAKNILKTTRKLPKNTRR